MSVLLLLMAAVLLTGCSSDGVTDGESHDGSPLELKAAVVSGLATRSTTASDNAWTVGDIVTVLDGSNSTAYQYTVSNASTGAMTGNITWGDDETTKTVTAWSYGGGTYTATLPASWSVATDQSQASYMQTNDFLYSPAVTATKGQSTTLTFAHETSMIFIRLKCSDGSITSASGITSVNLKAANVGTFSYSGSPAAASWSIGNATLVAMQPLSGTASGYLATFTALIIPQDMSGNEFLQFIATYNGTQKTFVYTPGTGEAQFGAGYKYIYDIDFANTKVTVTAVSTSWGYGGGTANPTAGNGSGGSWGTGTSGSAGSGEANGTSQTGTAGSWGGTTYTGLAVPNASVSWTADGSGTTSSGTATGTHETASGSWNGGTGTANPTGGSDSGGTWGNGSSGTSSSGTATGTNQSGASNSWTGGNSTGATNNGASGTWGSQSDTGTSSSGTATGTNQSGTSNSWTGGNRTGATNNGASGGTWGSGSSGTSSSGTATGTSQSGTSNSWTGGNSTGATSNGASGTWGSQSGSGTVASTEETWD